MPSAVKPSNVSRVAMLMQSNLLLNSIRTNTVDLMKVQNQLTTGLRLSRPSDGPAEASTIMHLDNLLESQQRYLNNADYAMDFLSSTDNALGQVNQLLTEAHTLALGSVGTAASDEGRQANALIIDQIIEQLVTLGNYQSRGSYIFAGQNTTEPPFEAYKGGVIYDGDILALETRVARKNLLEFNFNGDEVFGALSSQVRGRVDLNPDITVDTLLGDLNGALDRGVRLGSITVGDGTNSDTIDLSGCVTVGDVINKINNNTPATTTAAIGADGSRLQISSTLGGANVTVVEVGTGYTARDLGIWDNVGAGAALTGQDVDARLSLTTPVTALAGGAGIDLNNGLWITNSLLDDIGPLDLSGATTLGDIINTINNADLGVVAQINSDATGINILNRLSGSRMSIGENGGTTAADLGIRSLDFSTSLSDLNGGAGVDVSQDGVAGVIGITDRSGGTYSVDLSTAQTIQDVIDLINAATGGSVTAGLTGTGNGLELTDTTGGAGNLSVTTVSENGGFVATQLGFSDMNGNGLSVAGNTLTANDVNPIMPGGLFSHLIDLRDALRANDDQAIQAADNALMTDKENVVNYLGLSGARMRAVEQRKLHMEDNVLATEALRSDIRDIDFTEAITRYQNLYTALQGNLMTGNQLTNVSLLDFLG